MRVHFIRKDAGAAFQCPLFFLSETDAQEYVDNMTPPSGTIEIYKARLGAYDQNFSRIDTVYGEALVQSWKDHNINPSCIIEKDIF